MALWNVKLSRTHLLIIFDGTRLLVKRKLAGAQELPRAELCESALLFWDKVPFKGVLFPLDKWRYIEPNMQMEH